MYCCTIHNTVCLVLQCAVQWCNQLWSDSLFCAVLDTSHCLEFCTMQCCARIQSFGLFKYIICPPERDAVDRAPISCIQYKLNTNYSYYMHLQYSMYLQHEKRDMKKKKNIIQKPGCNANKPISSYTNCKSIKKYEENKPIAIWIRHTTLVYLAVGKQTMFNESLLKLEGVAPLALWSKPNSASQVWQQMFLNEFFHMLYYVSLSLPQS